MKMARVVIETTIAAALILGVLPTPAAAQEVDFNRDVLPLLSTRCFTCHGPDATARKAELRLDNGADATADRDGAAAAKPGEPGKSLLIDRISRGDKAGRMPPPKTGPGLTGDQIQLLTKWIEQGARYTEHWAFVAPKRPALPRVRERGFVQNPVDAFVLAALEQKKLPHADAASRRVLIRRATLDLLGLPPTPAEIDAFVNDKSPGAYEKLIDRLLQSPHYGERWGRHWLDVVRYADSGGFETDIFFSHAWRYRDYVIRSFNADKPFDRFVREQIAGDELFKGDAEAQLATAMYTLAPVLQESAMVTGSLEYDLLTDAADTTGSAFLGLTMGCARCHDHKYDPISQRDYFGMQALFAASDQFDIKADGSKINNNGKLAVKTTLPMFEVEQAKTRLRQETDAALRKKYLQQMAEFYVPLQKGKGGNKADPARLEAAEKFLDADSAIPVRVLAHRAKPLEVKLLKRGELNLPADIIAPALPAKLSGVDGAGEIPAQQRRAVLANWIASPANPLTARVMVNRVWQGHFGQGLVRTPNDFGIRGERPTHPELLDWLAVEFVEHGWSLKHLHRLIMLSSTYQMASTVPAKTLTEDPENRHLTHFQPRRLEAEVIWDLQRAVSGTIDLSMGGLSFAPPLDDQEQIGNFRKWPASLPHEANRRGLYILVKRSFRFPLLGAFDLPDNVSSCGQRDITTVPNQALALLNNRTVHEQARAFAARLLKETDGSTEAVAALAWQYAFSRAATEDERQKVGEFLKARRQALAATSPNAQRQALEEFCLALFNTNEFIYLP